MENKRNWIFAALQLTMMLLVAVVGGGVCPAAQLVDGVETSGQDVVDAANEKFGSDNEAVHNTHVPEASLTNPPNGIVTENVDATAGFPEMSVTVGENVAPETYQTAYDKVLICVRPFRTPIDQISRRIARTSHQENMEFRYGTIDYIPISTTLKTAVTSSEPTQNNEPVTIVPEKPGIFNRRDVVIVRDVKGYDAEGNETNEDLKLWVVNRTGNKSIDVIAINGKKSGSFSGVVPDIPAGTTLIRIAKAAAELDAQASGYTVYPSAQWQYMQKFMAQVEQSTIDRLTAKRWDITLSEQEEATLADMRLGMEGAWLFGTRGKFLDPETNRNVWTTGGIWNMVDREFHYTSQDDWTIGTWIDISKTMFTGPGAGRSDKRIVVCGSDLLALMEKVFVGNYTYIHSIKKWDLTFTDLRTNFGSFWFILDEVFDLHEMSGNGLIIEPEYLEKVVFEKFGRNTIDLNAQGVRDSKAVVLREISSMVLKAPDNHMKIIRDEE